MIKSALIVSCDEKGSSFFSELLNTADICQITAVNSCGEARSAMSENKFDLVLVNAPLRDESGEVFSRRVASNETSQVILVVKSEFFETVSASCGKDGVFTVSKPLSKSVFATALSLAKTSFVRLKRVYEENAKLTRKIEDIRIVDRAKLILISHMNMSEQQAHRHIEKQAMDLRSSKREIAEGILRTYEN